MSVEKGGSDGEEGLRETTAVDGEAASLLAEAGITATDIEERAVSYRELLDAGLDGEVAAELRTEHSLPWSFDLGSDLPDRSTEMRNLQDHERDWIAASAGDWEDREYDPVLPEREAVDVWADRERPTPVTAVPGVTDEHAAELEEVGIWSVKQLALANAHDVADVLDRDVRMLRVWRHQAREVR